MRSQLAMGAMALLVACGGTNEPENMTTGGSGGIASDSGVGGGGASSAGGAPSATSGGGGGAPQASGGSGVVVPGTALPCTEPYDETLNANPVNAEVGYWPEGCITDHLGSRIGYYPNPANDPAPKKGIYLYFHADFGEGYSCPESGEICDIVLTQPGNWAKWLDERDLVGLYILGKNVVRGGSQSVSWVEKNSPEELEAVAQTIRDAQATFQIPEGSPVFFASWSGGSVWLTRSWLPAKGNLFPGAYALYCGGVSDGTFTWDTATDPMKAKISLYFQTAQDDFLYDPSVASDWKALGFETTFDYPPSGGHCGGINSEDNSWALFDSWLAANVAP